MTFTDHNTFWRGQDICVKKSSIKAELIRFLKRLRRVAHPHVNTLDDRQLRDIGLAPKDVEAARHKLPSQHSFHPRA